MEKEPTTRVTNELNILKTRSFELLKKCIKLDDTDYFVEMAESDKDDFKTLRQKFSNEFQSIIEKRNLG